MTALRSVWRRLAVEVAASAAASALVVWAWRADAAWFERHVLPGYCACAGSPTWWMGLLRAVALVAAVLVAVFVRPRLARLAARASAGELVAVTVAILLALVVADRVLRRHPVSDATPLVRRDLPRALADPAVGWRFVPGQSVSVELGGRAVEYAIDADGDRAPSVTARVDPDRPTIVLAGESIAFGESRPWDETLAGRLAADLGLQIVDVGVPAYASDQAYLRAVEALDRLRRPVAVVTTFVPQVIRRNGLTARPHLELADGALVPAPPGGPPGLARLWRDEPYHGDRALELTRAIVAATARAARAHGAAPLFVVTNFGPPCAAGADAWIVRELFGGAAVPYVHVELSPEDTVGGGDRHPNASGARKLADAVERALDLRAARPGDRAARPDR